LFFKNQEIPKHFYDVEKNKFTTGEISEIRKYEDFCDFTL